MAEQESATQRVVMADDPATPIAVEVTRGGMVESVHRVAAAVVDRHGGARLTRGDGTRPIFPRSAIKPLQALTVIESGAADAFDLSADEIALSCASHRGEPMHVTRVAAWLERLGLTLEALECGPQMPGHAASARALIKAGEAPTPAHNNCSDKHAGMLTTACHLNEPVAGYSAADHPVQTRLIALIGALGGVDLSYTARGIDGCGIPVFGMPLAAVARAMANLADPADLSAPLQAAAKRIVAACAAHPLMLAGTDTFNSTVLAETGPRALIKGGAEGVYTAALPELGLGVCVKADDGAGRAASVAMGAILQHLGVLDAAAADRLAAYLNPQLTNWAGRFIGQIRPRGDLAF